MDAVVRELKNQAMILLKIARNVQVLVGKLVLVLLAEEQDREQVVFHHFRKLLVVRHVMEQDPFHTYAKNVVVQVALDDILKLLLGLLVLVHL